MSDISKIIATVGGVAFTLPAIASFAPGVVATATIVALIGILAFLMGALVIGEKSLGVEGTLVVLGILALGVTGGIAIPSIITNIPVVGAAIGAGIGGLTALLLGASGGYLLRRAVDNLATGKVKDIVR